MSEFWREYGTLIRVLLAGFVIFLPFLLCFPPQEMFISTTFIDTELEQASRAEIPVITRMKLSKEEHVRSFPLQLGDWNGVVQDKSSVKQQLGVPVLLMQTYTKSNPFQPVNLLVMESSSKQNFILHPPPDCYSAVGYEIEEEGKELINLTDTSWVEHLKQREVNILPDWARQKIETSPYYGRLSVKKLIIFKRDKGKIADRRVVLYLYIKHKDLISDRVGMVEASALAPPSGPYDAALGAATEVMGKAIPVLFEPRSKGEKATITHITDWGVGGYIFIFLMFSIPLTVIIYPVVAARRNRSVKMGQKGTVVVKRKCHPNC